MKTFIHRFSPTVSCTIEIGDNPPETATIDDRNVVWEGKPKPKHVPEYMRWCHEVNRQLANEWDKKIMQVFMISETKREFWAYEPGNPPKRLSEANE
jgi:hypothetical protein